MMHPSTLREVKLLRTIIIAYAPGTDENKRSYPNYYSTITVKPFQLDESGEVKIAIMRDLIRQLGLEVKIYSWIGGRMIIDINIEPKIQSDVEERSNYSDTSTN